MKIALALGTSAPTGKDDPGLQLSTGYSTAESQHFILRSELESSSGFFGIGSHDSKSAVTSPGLLTWAAVKNQFFTAILTPDEPAAGLTRVETDALNELIHRSPKMIARKIE